MRFDKSKAGLGCKGTLYGSDLFTKEIEGYLDELIWAFLKKGMQVQPHKHAQKELYIFVKGNGSMRVDDETVQVSGGDIVFIPSNSIHTAWNNENEELEFILVRTKNINSWVRKVARIFSVT
jgi:mannose-6-phosphate isomerase-like protein (cupin superfamily)